MKLSSVIVSVILIIGMCCDFILAERSTVSISPLNNKKDIKPAESINQRDPAPEFYRWVKSLYWFRFEVRESRSNHESLSRKIGNNYSDKYICI